AVYATLAELAHVSRARISQITNLLVLAPDGCGEVPEQVDGQDVGKENPFEDAIETDRDSFTPATTTARIASMTFSEASRTAIPGPEPLVDDLDNQLPVFGFRSIFAGGKP